MAHGKRLTYAMNFSPPSKISAASGPRVEVLLLQPFSKAPQLCFEDIPVGTEASRLIIVRNVLAAPSTVSIERVARDKGFNVEPQVFIVAPGADQLVKFLWKPADNSASCRVTVNVRSDQGYKGMLVLLATVKKSTMKVARKPRESSSLTVARSQQANDVVPSGCKETMQASRKTKRNITIPVEFSSRTEMRQRSRDKHTITYPVEHSTPNRNLQQASTFLGHSSEQTIQETFICNTPAAIDATGPADPDEELEDSLNYVTCITVGHGEELDDSLDVGHSSAMNDKTEYFSFSPPAQNLRDSVGNTMYNDSPNSLSSLNFSARMEALYEEVIQRQALGQSSDALEPALDKEFSIRMEGRYKKALARHQIPGVDSVEAGNEDIKMQDTIQSNPACSELVDIAVLWQQKLDDFFPANISSIHGSFVKL